MDHKNFDQWYGEKAHLYDSLAQSVVQIIKSIMKSEKISFVDVPYRIKAKDSCIGKLKKKSNYTAFEDMTDLAGLRIITLVESDLEKVSKIISENFNVHEEDSGDKADLLGADKFGYRSIHFVCDIGKQREQLPEFTLYKDLCFEIQIRTALSHAWAEIEHDRGYKLGGELPKHLKRRFNLLSGLLESADLEFNRLTAEIEEYKEKLKSSKLEDLLDLDINKISLRSFLNLKLAEQGFDLNKLSIKTLDNPNNMIYKLNQAFGLKTIMEIDKIWEKNKDKAFSLNPNIEYIGTPLVRIYFIENLFKALETYKSVLGFIFLPFYQTLVDIYDKKTIDNALKKFNIKLIEMSADEYLEKMQKNKANKNPL